MRSDSGVPRVEPIWRTSWQGQSGGSRLSTCRSELTRGQGIRGCVFKKDKGLNRSLDCGGRIEWRFFPVKRTLIKVMDGDDRAGLIRSTQGEFCEK